MGLRQRTGWHESRSRHWHHLAVDPVLTVFAIITAPYIAHTSNILAILGLRALHFALAAALHRCHDLKHAPAIPPVFIGSRIFTANPMG
jgi:tellurite resistance protein TerC